MVGWMSLVYIRFLIKVFEMVLEMLGVGFRLIE